jgi:hypothetical protein
MRSAADELIGARFAAPGEASASGPRALFAAPAAGSALAPGRTGVVELVLSKGSYVRLDEDWLMLAGPEVAFGPLSLVISGRLAVEPEWRVSVLADRVALGPVSLSLARMRERRTADIAGTGVLSADARASAAAARAAMDGLPAPPGYLAGGIAAMALGKVGAAVAALAGLGEGLTPAGDDILAGYAGAQVARGRLRSLLSSLAAGRASPLGLAYLRCAERGELPDVAARLLAAICRGSVQEAVGALRTLREWGASSGVALGWGMAAAFGASCSSGLAGARSADRAS